MKKTIISAAFLGLSLCFFSSCKKDKEETPTVLSVAESKTTLDQTANSLKADMTAMVENESIDIISNFSGMMGNLESSNMRTKKSYKGYVNIIKDALNNAQNASNARMTEEDFDLTTTKGTYEWDASIEDFKKTSSSTDKLIIKFPSVENGTVNDATLTLNAYTEDANYNPTKVDLALTKNNSAMLSIYFVATFDSESDPTYFDGKVVMAPFTMTADFKHTGTSVSFNTKIQNANQSIPMASTSVNATFADNTLDTIDKISGSAQLYETTVVASVNVKEIQSKIEDTEDTEVAKKLVNDNADVYFQKTSTKQKIGDVVLDVVKDTNGEEMPKLYVVYNDNTKEDLEVVFEKVIDEVASTFEDLTGETMEEANMRRKARK